MKAEDKKELEEKLEALKKAKESNSQEEMKKGLEALNTVAQRIGAAMYQQAGAGAAGTGASNPGANPNNHNDGSSAQGQAESGQEKKDDVVEGEVEENK